MNKAVTIAALASVLVLATPASAPAGADKAPTPEEWKTAPEAKVARTDKRCKVQRVRDWMRIGCKLAAAAVSQIAGSRDGVLTYIEAPAQPTGGFGFVLEDDRAASITFPLRRGDARYFEIPAFRGRLFCNSEICWGEGNTWYSAIRISEQWVDGDAPIVSIFGVVMDMETWVQDPVRGFVLRE